MFCPCTGYLESTFIHEEDEKGVCWNNYKTTCVRCFRIDIPGDMWEKCDSRDRELGEEYQCPTNSSKIKHSSKKKKKKKRKKKESV
jgi:hypothetical protein